ncbi:MAG: type II toxin-antitoxin system VapC family toxin [Chloroflexi bacterium]|nr:type II toxin-antitoxin system VapC family toxin [Chloroflexota bacterium]
MIVDSSAIAAVVFGEPDAAAYARLIAAAPIVRISAATFVEVGIVIDGAGNPILSGALDALLSASLVIVEPLTESQARIARVAYQRFGKGSGHPARLNMGDCFSYALARDLGEPLLFKGDDFTLTDIELVIEPIKHKRLSEVVASYGVGTR